MNEIKKQKYKNPFFIFLFCIFSLLFAIATIIFTVGFIMKDQLLEAFSILLFSFFHFFLSLLFIFLIDFKTIFSFFLFEEKEKNLENLLKDTKVSRGVFFFLCFFSFYLFFLLCVSYLRVICDKTYFCILEFYKEDKICIFSNNFCKSFLFKYFFLDRILESFLFYSFFLKLCFHAFLFYFQKIKEREKINNIKCNKKV